MMTKNSVVLICQLIYTTYNYNSLTIKLAVYKFHWTNVQ